MSSRAEDGLSRRVLLRQAVIGVCVVAAVLGVIPVAVWLLFGSNTQGAITEQQYQSLRQGETEAQTTGMLGPPDTQHIAAPSLPSVPRGANCRFYYETDSLMDGNVYRVCFVNGRLATKAEYTSGGTPARCPAPSPRSSAGQEPRSVQTPWSISVTC